jgi:N-methylhydantoinase B
MTTLTTVQPGASVHSEPEPIGVEVLRSRLEALGREAGLAVERTAISPVVSETKDYSVTIIDAKGRLITGIGYITAHFGASVNAVRATMARHGGTIAPGDVFLANDPHNGGGLHPNDVIVQRPAFAEGTLVGWVAVSAHMMDMGGMTPGSLSPHATECFQEALRFPPVRLLRQGEEQSDIWSILRINVRSAPLVEADLRALVVGCNVAVAKIEEAVAALGAERFTRSIAALERATQHALAQRVEAIADGVYRSAGWLELGESEVYSIPCRMIVAGSRLVFDFTGCPAQLPRYFNSKPYIVQSALASKLHMWLAADLPYSQAFLDLMDVRCPPASLLNCEPPAPIGAAHMDATGAGISAAMQCMLLALGASPDAPERRLLSAPPSIGWAMMTWAFQRQGGGAGSFIHTDGILGGSPAGADRDGIDLSSDLVGTKGSLEMPDVEILEAAYPILVEERNSGKGSHGLGAYRSGGACHEVLRPHGIESLMGFMISTRGSVPNPGAAGGGLGTRTSLKLLREDGASEDVPLQAAGARVAGNERFEFWGPTAGGFGDPLSRPVELVSQDVRQGRITADEAERFYAVVLSAGTVDQVASEALRHDRRKARLRRARAPERAVAAEPLKSAKGLPLFPGIVQVGSRAVSEDSGAVLAEAPHPWTGGCCVLDEQDIGANGYVVATRSYLDPLSGRRLLLEILQRDGSSLFECSPDRWTGRDVAES